MEGAAWHDASVDDRAVARAVLDGDRDAFQLMDEPYREVVALRFFAELSLPEIAEATGRPLNTVKTHLRRGMERLRDALGIEVIS